MSVKYTTRKETMKNVERLVVSEELLRLKALNETMSVEERRTFVINWKKANKYLLVSQLGSKTQCLRFVHGVFFAPSYYTKTVPQLQRLFMAALFCCYGVTANANISPVAFGIVFGNENGESWAEMDDVWVCSVKRVEMGREHAVTIPKEPVRGSHFGRCTCGVDRQDSAPCEHMVAVAASSCLPGVTRHNVMPYWWTRAHWRMQIPQEPLGITNVSMSSIITDNEPDHNLRYCPDWTANQKSGRPKKDKRKKSVLESATGSKGTKRATGVKRAR